MRRLVCVASVAVAAAFAGTAAAQSGAPLELTIDDPLFEGPVAPGYETADERVIVPVRDPYLVFGESPVEARRAFDDLPLNEFAGQRRRIEPGIIGDALGGVKRSIFGTDR